ncbi:hypothetical protein D3C76_1117330 [compost metagenome]
MFSMLFVSAAPGCNLPNNLTPLVLFALLDPGITRVGADHVFFAMQQFVDLRDVRHIGRRDHHAMNQARLIVDADVGLGTEVILIAFLGLMHLRVALAILVFG